MTLDADTIRLNAIAPGGVNDEAQVALLTFKVDQDLENDYNFDLVVDSVTSSSIMPLTVETITDQSVGNANENGSLLDMLIRLFLPLIEK